MNSQQDSQNKPSQCEEICKELVQSISNPVPKPRVKPKERELLTDLQELLIFWGP
jgi:hypothetical protein